METLKSLTKLTVKKNKRIGRGYGSGVGGHTSTRGAKGQKVRSKVKLTFDGTKIKKSWIKRLPFLRGKHRMIIDRGSHSTITLSQLSKFFKDGQTVSPQTLNKLGFIKNETDSVKILCQGEITKKLNIKDINLSKTAANKIIAAGGKID